MNWSKDIHRIRFMKILLPVLLILFSLFIIVRMQLNNKNMNEIHKENEPTYTAYWLTSPDQESLPARLSHSYMWLLLSKFPLEKLSVPLPHVNDVIVSWVSHDGIQALSSDAKKEYLEKQVKIAEDLLGFPVLKVMTFARDSIWNTDFSPFKSTNGIQMINKDSKTLKMDGELYRYFTADLSEVIELLKNPEGILPLARLAGPIMGQEEFVARLLTKLQPASVVEKENAINIELYASVEPVVWYGLEIQDVTILLTLKNSSDKPITIYPDYTELSWKMSNASMGMKWSLEFVPSGPGINAVGKELRTWYGPPGEPVTDQTLKEAGVKLNPGAEKKTTLYACWIPRSLLDPANLSVSVLDPDGYDNLKSIPNIERSSVLVFNVSSAVLKKEMGKKKDFLRGYMVVFFSSKGKYALRVGYHQSTSMSQIVEAFAVDAKPVEIVILADMLACALSQSARDVACSESYTFTARITRIEPLATPNRAVHLYPVEEVRKKTRVATLLIGADARYAVQLEVIATAQDSDIFDKGQTVTIGIHSPIKLFSFASKEAIGEQLVFNLSVTFYKDGLMSFDCLSMFMVP